MVEQIVVTEVAVEQINVVENKVYGADFVRFNVVEAEPPTLNEGEFYIILTP